MSVLGWMTKHCQAGVRSKRGLRDTIERPKSRADVRMIINFQIFVQIKNNLVIKIVCMVSVQVWPACVDNRKMAVYKLSLQCLDYCCMAYCHLCY